MFSVQMTKTFDFLSQIEAYFIPVVMMLMTYTIIFFDHECQLIVNVIYWHLR